ncbi:AbrB/MazE/SpoVT family DNA-binding domain-containing protein [Natronomonas sp. EA1]|uniref:AbrB/MazE/SpoVT family DNA-binding domain-containing protein n=1 Tax=Natronomonas sp. EA1 TaxID=3421655 RepID=UPI003EB76362
MPKVTTKGQVTIPKAIRDRLGIDPGDEVEFVETNEGYVLRKTPGENPFEKWKGSLETDRTTEEIMDELRGR